jgi:hypothetical protein
MLITTAGDEFPLDAVIQKAISENDAESQYEIGFYWLRQDHLETAEQWLRYAAWQGHKKAILLLQTGIENEFFKKDDDCLYDLVYNFFEGFVTPEPSQTAIETLVQVIKSHFHKNHK